MSYGFGIIGLGLIADFHARAIKEMRGGKLVACCSRSLEKADQFAEKYQCKGYSSLSYLKQFPVNALKIDRSFIQNISNEKSGMAMVAAIIKLAHALNLEVVAEGVEELKELQILKDHDCKYVQGYYFSKPLSVKDFTKKLEEQNLVTN